LKYNTASLVGKIRDSIHKMIVFELEKHGVEGIVPSHGDILWFLYQKDMLSVKELAEKIDRTQPTVTVLVNKLEKLGYVERVKSKEDSRVTLIYLTEKGKQLQPIFQEISVKLNDSIYGGFDDHEKEQLEYLLETILQKL